MEDSTKAIIAVVGSIIGIVAIVLVYNQLICGECLFKLGDLKLGGGGGGAGGGAGGVSFVETPSNPWAAFGGISAIVIPIIIVLFLLYFFRAKIWPNRFGAGAGRGAGAGAAGLEMVPLQAQGGTPTDSTPQYVAPREWGDAIKALAGSPHNDNVLIEGRAALTMVSQALLFQKKSSAEGLGALYGRFNNNGNPIILFALPVPIYTSKHFLPAPKWELAGVTKKIRTHDLLDNTYCLPQNRQFVANLISSLSTNFKGFTQHDVPLTAPIRSFFADPVLKLLSIEKLHDSGYFLDTFGQIGPVSWYHNHPMVSGIAQNTLMVPVRPVDVNAQCDFQRNWARSAVGNRPVSVLVGTNVTRDDAVMKFNDSYLGFKVWKSDNCAAGGTAVDVPNYRIFCMDALTFEWYKKYAKNLVDSGVVLDWYKTYYEEVVKKQDEAVWKGFKDHRPFVPDGDFMYVGATPDKIKQVTGWKIVVYADNTADLINIARALKDLLRSELKVAFRILQSHEKITLLPQVEKGKAIEVFVLCGQPKDAELTRQKAKEIVKALDNALNTPQLRLASAPTIRGYKEVPATNSKRLLYAYALDAKRDTLADDLAWDAFKTKHDARKTQLELPNSNFNIADNPDIFP